jgi:hypothetical protein
MVLRFCAFIVIRGLDTLSVVVEFTYTISKRKRIDCFGM